MSHDKVSGSQWDLKIITALSVLTPLSLGCAMRRPRLMPAVTRSQAEECNGNQGQSLSRLPSPMSRSEDPSYGHDIP